MKIIIIADNYVDKPCMVAEHGFSCLIEANGKRILFDTGQGEALLTNMRELGISENIDMIVFSHGHYDHTGGLSRYLKELSCSTGDIYASRHIFDKHLKKSNGGEYSFIGFDTKSIELQKDFELHLNGELTEISDGIFLSGPVMRFEEFDADQLLYVNIDGMLGKDMFRDEQYLIISEGDGIHLITGCTHCGAVNLILDAKEKFPDKKILSLTGGLHMFRSDAAQMEHVICYLKREGITNINTGHCTGLEAAMKLRQAIGSSVKITKVGMEISL